MKKIEAIVRSGRLDRIKEALNLHRIQGLTVTQVMGCGNQKGRREVFRGTEINVNLTPKVKIELITPDDVVEAAIETIIREARTGEVGDGKIFVYDVLEAIRIRTGERNDSAI